MTTPVKVGIVGLGRWAKVLTRAASKSDKLQVTRHAHVGMVEQHFCKGQLLPQRERARSRANRDHLCAAPRYRSEEFSEVKAHPGARVEIAVDVVRLVQPPEHRNAMQQNVPPVQRVIHERDRKRGLHGRGSA